MSHIGDILIVGLKWLVIFALIGWVGWRALKNTEDDRLISKWIITAAVLPVAVWIMISTGPFFGVPMAAACGVILGVMWAPNVGGILAIPFTSLFDGGGTEIEPAPFYSIAEARRKQGRYAEALAEVEQQLVKFPNDFQGWLLLAQIQAEDLKDIAAAQTTIEKLVNQGGHAPKNVAHALNRLADWQLKFGVDLATVRETFEQIRERFPDTELAQMAAQRIAHLCGPDSVAQPREARLIPVPHLGENVGLRADFKGLELPGVDHDSVAAKLVKHLAAHPLDYEAREQLARLYVEHFARLDLATDQLEQMINHPHQPEKQIVHWLNLLADWQIRFAQDVNAARCALERIVERFPEHAAAEIARNRLRVLGLEIKGQQKSQAVKLGSYEQNLGLKKGWLAKDPPT
ncbi:MAG: hypothetical protein HY043_00880 [Verrucomicrobia bacterium]|nr:hypothetical protein [Verrucomicrobiota bacterium]